MPDAFWGFLLYAISDLFENGPEDQALAAVEDDLELALGCQLQHCVLPLQQLGIYQRESASRREEEHMRSRIGSPRALRLIAGVLLVVIVLGGAVFFLASGSRAAPEQPIAFDHKAMAQKGISCLFCHSDATKSPAAGMPSVEKCMGCHNVIAVNAPEIKELADYWQRREPIPWARVNRLPRFVYFSHRVHVVAGGFNCERCHGDVGHMTVAQPVVNMNMGWCLTCHEQQPNAGQLGDCIVCHQ
jgi:hypothetical protein